MSLRIEIGVGADVPDPKGYLDIYMNALGFERSGDGPRKIGAVPELAAGYGDQKTETAAEPAKATRARKAKDEAKPAISTNPEDRRPPEDDAATQAQDEADEKAEVEANREPEKPLTVDDVRAALGKYVTKHGMPATQDDGPKIFVAALGNPPAGEQFWKLSLLGDLSQDKLKAAVTKFEEAAASDKRYGA